MEMFLPHVVHLLRRQHVKLPDVGAARHSFDIRTSKDFFRKLEEECADFQRNRLSARHAINAAMTAWHLHDWLWADRLKGNLDQQRRIFNKAVPGRNDCVTALLNLCPELSIMRAICNGSKHFSTFGEVKDTGPEIDRAYSSQLGRAQMGRIWTGRTGLPYLAVTTDAGESMRFESVLHKALSFWSDIFASY